MSVEALLADPQQYDFFRAVFAAQRQLGRSHGLAAVGHDADPKREALRFRVAQTLDYAGAPVRRASQQADGRVELNVALFGLTGPAGVLPLHYRELVIERSRQKDTGLRDFLDLFNHRLLALLYRSWEKYRLPVAASASGCSFDDPFGVAMQALTGASSPLELFVGGLLQRRVRSAGALQAILAELLGLPVQVSEWRGAFMSLAPDEQSRLCSRARPEGQHARLGEALVGSRVWDCSAGFDVTLEVTTADQWRALKPGGSRNLLATELVSRFVGVGWRYRILVSVPRKLLSSATLSGRTALGHGYLLAGRRPKLSGNCLFSLRSQGRAAPMKGIHDVHHDA